MNWEQRRMLERAGILRRRTPDRLLLEGDEGGDDLFGDDGGDDGGGDDLFGDDAGGDDAGGDAGGGEEDGGEERIPPEELSADDIEKFGSPRFLDIETNIKNMFNDAMTSAGAASQNNEFYPGNAIPEEAEDTPAKDDEPEDAGDEGEDEADEEANESFYRYGNRRDKWLINEAQRLLLEAEEEGSAADVFDMERFCTELANYMDNIHNTEDIESGIFNGARQMILNNFGPDTEQEFIDMLGSVASKQYKFLQTGFEDQQEEHIAIGAGGGGGGGV